MGEGRAGSRAVLPQAALWPLGGAEPALPVRGGDGNGTERAAGHGHTGMDTLTRGWTDTDTRTGTRRHGHTDMGTRIPWCCHSCPCSTPGGCPCPCPCPFPPPRLQGRPAGSPLSLPGSRRGRSRSVLSVTGAVPVTRRTRCCRSAPVGAPGLLRQGAPASAGREALPAFASRVPSYLFFFALY